MVWVPKRAGVLTGKTSMPTGKGICGRLVEGGRSLGARRRKWQLSMNSLVHPHGSVGHLIDISSSENSPAR